MCLSSLVFFSRYEQESSRIGKSSFAFAWVLDQTGEERKRCRIVLDNILVVIYCWFPFQRNYDGYST